MWAEIIKMIIPALIVAGVSIATVILNNRYNRDSKLTEVRFQKIETFYHRLRRIHLDILELAKRFSTKTLPYTTRAEAEKIMRKIAVLQIDERVYLNSSAYDGFERESKRFLRLITSENPLLPPDISCLSDEEIGEDDQGNEILLVPSTFDIYSGKYGSAYYSLEDRLVLEVRKMLDLNKKIPEQKKRKRARRKVMKRT